FVLPVSRDGLKPVLALVRLDVSPPSIRWLDTSLILHARYAVFNIGNMPHLTSRLRGAPRHFYGHVHFGLYSLAPALQIYRSRY
ncbi:hypothetical protein AB3X94_42030, partial [Paraburkholderia sp. BR10923]|uniref:hypothetical protein n=1 Tax=Paraburkholderia sp. BR10923 TaxID=3236992 RepID=UPI0034CD6764